MDYSINKHMVYGEWRAKNTELITISQQEFNCDDENLRKKLAIVAQQGIFYLEIGQEDKTFIPDAIKFCSTFYQKEEFTSLGSNNYIKTDNNVFVYSNSPEEQIESFMRCKNMWKKIDAQFIQNLGSIQNLGNNLMSLSSKIVHQILTILVPDCYLNKIFDFLNNARVDCLIFNHYQLMKDQVGAEPHTDLCCLSLLFPQAEGLLAFLEGTWQSIQIKKELMIVILGLPFQKLINNPNNLNACFHAVKKVEQDRTSFLFQFGNSPRSFNDHVWFKNINLNIIRLRTILYYWLFSYR